jgi:hypothetical protein
MTSVRLPQHHFGRVSRPRDGTRLRQILLLCGVLSAILYAATDILGSMWYPGYSFTSQAVSELMAAGAPSENFVDPLFLISGALSIAFTVGVFLAAEGRRDFRIAAVLLFAYSVIGLTGPTLFEMHPRGTGSTADDAPHIILTAVISVLFLFSIGIGGFALGGRFRVYSLVTILTAITFGAMTVPYAVRLAHNQPTPGMGLLERVDIYATMVWLAAFALALISRQVKLPAPPSRPDG